MTPEDIAAVAAGLTEFQRQSLIAAQPHENGEIFARCYSVPDRFTKAFRVHGLGDALNPLGRAVRQHLQERTR